MAIKEHNEYIHIMGLIESLLQKATSCGGFQSLNPKEGDNLERLSILAEEYEDNVLQLGYKKRAF